MKKRLNETGIMNELRGGSSFFPKAKPPESDPVSKEDNKVVFSSQSTPTATETPIERKSDRTDNRSVGRSENRTVGLPQKRLTRRYSFEFYDDQITRLKQLKYQAEMQGQRASLSDYARTALDRFLDEIEGD